MTRQNVRSSRAKSRDVSRLRSTRTALGLALGLTLASPLAAQTIAITGGTVALGDGSEPMSGATVVLRNGRIVAAGPNVAVPRDAQIIDARGKWVTPGIVAGFSRLGLAEVDLTWSLWLCCQFVCSWRFGRVLAWFAA